MPRTFSDSDFAPQQARTFTDADFHDAPAEAAPQGISPMRALLTNDKTSGITEDLIRGIPATIGGVIGATVGGVAGTPTGPGAIATSMAGAGLGGAAGEGARQNMAQLYAAASGRDMATPGQVVGGMASQGVAQGIGHGVGLAIGGLASAARPLVNKLGAQALRVTQGIPEKIGMQAMETPSKLFTAPTPDVASAGYQAFERYTGLKGLADQVKTMGKFPSEGELEKHLFEVAARARNGVESTPQELYHASQAASSLNQMAKMGNPRYAMLNKEIGDAKGAVDDALQAVYPEYKNLRSDWAASKVRGAFSSLFPQNVNTSPNVLRAVVAGQQAVEGVSDGKLYKALALPIISPMVGGTLIRGAAVAGAVPPAVYQVGAKALTGAAGSALADAYLKPQVAR